MTPLLARRHVTWGLVALSASPALGQSILDATDFGVVGGGGLDQTASLQAALDAARVSGGTVTLPAGTIEVGALRFPARLALQGVPGATVLMARSGTIGTIAEAQAVVLSDLVITGGGSGDEALLSLASGNGIVLERCRFESAPGVALAIGDASATVRDCSFLDSGDAAIHAQDSRGVLLAGNRITGAGNAGIRIWRSEPGPDGSILQANRIAQVDWRGGGNGENGNGINVFNADNVIVADNSIEDCAFSAIRLNTTRNCQVSGNTCLTAGEIAIYSEFNFSGSVIANNIVDGAATGISITNLDAGGHLAVCSGNIVRNIAPRSVVNPDASPVGIAAEADTAITGNTISGVPGLAIAAGYGTFLRNVAIAGNVITESRLGIGVSVVEGAGSVRLGSNMVDAGEHDLVGLAWDEVVETDLAANRDRYPHVSFG